MDAAAVPTTTLTGTRSALQRAAVHVLARRRFEVAGRFGLRAAPGGLATPAFGPDPEVLRTAGRFLVREVGGRASAMVVPGATLRELAAFAGTDLSAPFEAGGDTPPVGDPDEPLVIDRDALACLTRWFTLAWAVLDEVTASLPAPVVASTVQVWPEHFDAATAVDLGGGAGVNLGFSPGDGFEAEPYVYVGPWGSERPGDPAFWNAPFGAVRAASVVDADPDPAAVCRAFLRAGLAALGVGGSADPAAAPA
jgi:hypothetical protein